MARDAGCNIRSLNPRIGPRLNLHEGPAFNAHVYAKSLEVAPDQVRHHAAALVHKVIQRPGIAPVKRVSIVKRFERTRLNDGCPAGLGPNRSCSLDRTS